MGPEVPSPRVRNQSIMTHLLRDENAIIEHLTLKDRMKIMEKYRQLIMAVSEWYNDGHSMIC